MSRDYLNRKWHPDPCCMAVSEEECNDEGHYKKAPADMTYKEKAAEIAALVEEKQKAYGDSFTLSGDILQILYPNGLQPEQYKDALAITRVIDKLFRIANQKDAFGEDPWADICGYALLSMRDK